MEYTELEPVQKQEAAGVILCCDCGVAIAPNPSNMCVTCLRNHIDITEGIPKQAVLHFCKNCERYLQPPSEWIQCALESRELLALCLKKLTGLKDVKLVDAGFIWTEPHSKRIKVKLTVHGEIVGGTVLQQVFVVEFTVQYQMCNDCHRVEAKDFWRCSLQIRQRCENKKTFFYLEQLILKHKAHENTLGIKQIHGGLDFFYAQENDARKMIDFLQAVVPVRTTTSKRLISTDIHSNICNYKFTYSVEIAPISKDSAVCLSKKQRQQLGSISAVCLVHKVASKIHLIDPTTAQIAEITANAYFRAPFVGMCNPKQLVEFIVMDIEIIKDKDRKVYPGQGTVSFKHVLCDVWVVKASELGINDNPIHTKCHLGHLLKVGDSALGYNLVDANINDETFEKLNSNEYPDVILVKKFYGDRLSRHNTRLWKLKHLAEDEAEERKKNDYQEFLEDLEEDQEFRQNINIYRDTSKQIPIDSSGVKASDNSTPQITLAEMLDDLVLDDDAMGDDV